MNKEFLNLSIKTNKAFLEGLVKSNILKRSDAKKIQKKLSQIPKDKNFLKNFKKSQLYQDQILNYLKKRLKKLSQIIPEYSTNEEHENTTIRIYSSIKLKIIKKDIKKIANKFLNLAQKNKNTPYKNSTIAHHFLSFTESLINDLSLIENSIKQINKNPIGSKEVEKILERDFVTKNLELKETIINSIFAKKSQIKLDSIYFESLNQITLSLNDFLKDIENLDQKTIKVKKSLGKGSEKMQEIKNLQELIGEISLEKTLLLNLKNLAKRREKIILYTEKIFELLETTMIYLQNFKINEDKIQTKKISLGSAGNLDLHFYKRKLSKL